VLLNWTYASVRKPERIVSQKVDIKNYNIPLVKLLHCDSFTLNYCTRTLSKRASRCCISTPYSQSHNLRTVPFNWPRIYQEHRNKAHINRSNMFQIIIAFCTAGDITDFTGRHCKAITCSKCGRNITNLLIKFQVFLTTWKTPYFEAILAVCDLSALTSKPFNKLFKIWHLRLNVDRKFTFSAILTHNKAYVTLL